MVLVGVVLRRPSSVRREAVMDELPREVGRASRREETRTWVARRRERGRHRRPVWKSKRRLDAAVAASARWREGLHNNLTHWLTSAGVAFLCLVAHCSISGALANYALESIVKRSRTLVFLAHMQDLRTEANSCCPVKPVFLRDFSLCLKFIQGYLGNNRNKASRRREQPVNRPLDVAIDSLERRHR